MNSTKGYLFENAVVSNATVNALGLGNTPVAAKTSETLPFVSLGPRYVYPSSSTNGYTLTANWNSLQQNLPLLSPEDNAVSLTAISKGKALNIEITLKPGEDDFTYTVEVGAWNDFPQDEIEFN